MRAAISWLALLSLPATVVALPTPAPDVLRLTPEMERFLEEEVPRGSTRTRLHGLFDALFGKKGLSVDYSNTRTRSAAETFESRTGNCLSFTMMFGSMARHVGLDVDFMEVGEVLSWNERGSFVFNNKHIYAEVQLDTDVVRVDFLPGVEKRYRDVRVVDDRRVAAHYYNNLGAERLAEADTDGALELFRRAVEIDPTSAWAWVNLGVALRRQGDLDGAERAYRKAFELDPGELTAVSNLARLYESSGRKQLAKDYEERAERYRHRNPYEHFRRAITSFAAGESGETVVHARRAIRREPSDARFWKLLADAQSNLGHDRRARRSYQRALVYAKDDRFREAVEERLAEFEPGG